MRTAMRTVPSHATVGSTGHAGAVCARDTRRHCRRGRAAPAASASTSGRDAGVRRAVRAGSISAPPPMPGAGAGQGVAVVSVGADRCSFVTPVRLRGGKGGRAVQHDRRRVRLLSMSGRGGGGEGVEDPDANYGSEGRNFNASPKYGPAHLPHETSLHVSAAISTFTSLSRSERAYPYPLAGVDIRSGACWEPHYRLPDPDAVVVATPS